MNSIEALQGLIKLLISMEENIEERILNEDSPAVLEQCHEDRIKCIMYISLCQYLLHKGETNNER